MQLTFTSNENKKAFQAQNDKLLGNSGNRKDEAQKNLLQKRDRATNDRSTLKKFLFVEIRQDQVRKKALQWEMEFFKVMAFPRKG